MMMVNRVEAERRGPLQTQRKELLKDVLLMIFDRLSEADLARSRRVCRQWNVVGRDERLTRKFQHAFGARCWYRYFGQVGVEPLLPGDIGAILNGPCPFWQGKKVYETHLLVMIPEQVNGRPFTLNSLEAMIEGPKQGHATRYRQYWDKLKKQCGTQAVLRKYWVLVTRDVIPGSRNKDYSEQQKLVGEYWGYALPKLIEMATCVLMEHVKTGKFLYGNDPWTYTRCQEHVFHHKGIIGGFSSEGLDLCGSRFVNHDDGVGVARTF